MLYFAYVLVLQCFVPLQFCNFYYHYSIQCICYSGSYRETNRRISLSLFLSHTIAYVLRTQISYSFHFWRHKDFFFSCLKSWRMEQLVHYEKLAHTIMDTEKSLDLPSPSWRPRGSGIQFRPHEKAENQGSWCFKSLSQGWRRWDEMSWLSSQEAKQGWIPPSSALCSILLSYSGLQWVGWSLVTLGRAVCLTESTVQIWSHLEDTDTHRNNV